MFIFSFVFISLLFVKSIWNFQVIHWDEAVREQTALSLEKLAEVRPDLVAAKLNFLVEGCRNTNPVWFFIKIIKVNAENSDPQTRLHFSSSTCDQRTDFQRVQIWSAGMQIHFFFFKKMEKFWKYL